MNTKMATNNGPGWPLATAPVAAGLFEGEGTITISWAGWRNAAGGERRRYTRPVVTLASTDREIVAFFDAHWLGCICRRPPSKTSARARQSWTWTLNSQAAIIDFLDDIAPYVVTTRMKKRIALLRIDIGLRRGKGKKRKSGYREGCAGRLQTMRELNRRGVTPGGMTVGDILVPRLKAGEALGLLESHR